MQVEQVCWTAERGWFPADAPRIGSRAKMVLAFGATAVLRRADLVDQVRRWYPNARIAFCSTAGEIYGTAVIDDSLVVTAVSFDSARVQGVQVELEEGESSDSVGRRLGALLDPADLVHVLVFSDGLQVNGTELIGGLGTALPDGVTITGGLSGDGDRFGETLVGLDAAPAPGRVLALGLAGERLRVGFGSLGGWDPFGPERRITRSEGNVLYELDGSSALALYKKYLGEHADRLPGSGLLFPLAIRTETREGVVRTILAVDEDEQSLTFAGDVPEGAYARLMKANFDRLIDGATGAASACAAGLGSSTPDLAILISCVGRKMVLKQRTEEEVEGVRDVLGSGATLAGFYSYGEISPGVSGSCELHNQTMTITTLAEA